MNSPQTSPRDGDGLYYKPSGKVPLAGVAGGLVGGLAAGFALAYAYANLIYLLPFHYINFLCTFGYAALLAATPGYVMRWGKVRHGAAYVGITAVVAAASLYLSWAVWVSLAVPPAELGVSALELAGRPLRLWELMVQTTGRGTWTFFGIPVMGFALWAVWAVEALIVLAAAPAIAHAMATGDPFCENCRRWCKYEQGVAVVASAADGDLKRRLEAKDFRYLRELGAKREGDAEWLRVDLHLCPGCGQTNTLSVHREKMGHDLKGKPMVTSDALMRHLLLDAADLRELRAAAAADPPEPAYA